MSGEPTVGGVQWSRKMFVPIPSFVPKNAEAWPFNDSYWRDSWGVRRRLPFVRDHPHKLAEGVGGGR